MLDLTALSDFGLGWLEASGPNSDIVLSTRVRLARNLQGLSFTSRCRPAERAQVYERLSEAVESGNSLTGGVALDLTNLNRLSRQVLLERHLISREMAGDGSEAPAPGAGLFLGPKEVVGVMVNEEDHLRLQALLSGLRLQEAYSLVDQLDEELGAQLPFAYHPEFGYLTSCPTNVGTGLRASVLVHLPGLVLTKEIGKVLQGIGQVGLTFRGLYGEGSEVVGNFFQISNQTTLGKSEEDLVDHLNRIVQQVITYEMQARSVLMRDAPAVIEDKIWRAYGLLRYARSLSFEEVMNLLSGVRLGVSMKLLPGLRVYTLNKIMIYTQAAHLEQAAGRPLTESDSDLHRAAYVRRILATEGSVSEDREALDENGRG
ncbi:MAG TPA: protein arginine kinase [Longimicrobiales bacterium]|nr:protein arginine kinase [Longimicrobiales bacterium]